MQERVNSISYDLKHVSVYVNEREKIQVYFQNSSFRNYLVPMVSFLKKKKQLFVITEQVKTCNYDAPETYNIIYVFVVLKQR